MKALIFAVLLMGCATTKIPESAGGGAKACVDKGLVVTYHATTAGVTFSCANVEELK